MATYYIDLENGNDSNDGTSFANRWKNLTKASGTVSGDTIRIMGSPAPTILGSGTWDGSGKPTTVSITSSTNATPIVITAASHGLSSGDFISLVNHTVNTNANGEWVVTVLTSSTFSLDGSTGNGVGGATGSFCKRNNNIVTLSSAVNANIASNGNVGSGRTAWTAASNVTSTILTTDTKQGSGSDSIAIAAAFTTGKAAYKATGALNLSSYQQISFWIKQTAGTVAISGDISIRLCTDSIGDTSVHTVSVPGIGALNTWAVFTVDLNTNLNSNINSVALYVDTDRGAQTFLLCNIIACKNDTSADSLTLNSLIGKNTTGEGWWPISSIVGTRIVLGSVANHTLLFTGAGNSSTTANSSFFGYYGTSETITTYKRECIYQTLVGGTTAVQTISSLGTSGLINYEFGWDRTNMTTQNLETFVDGRNGFGIFLFVSSNKDYNSFNKLNLTRFNYGLYFSNCSNCVVSSGYYTGCSRALYPLSSSDSNTYSDLYFNHNAYAIIMDTVTQNILSNITSVSNNEYGIYLDTTRLSSFNNIILKNNIATGGFGVAFSDNNTITSGTLDKNTRNLYWLYSFGNKFSSITSTNATSYGLLSTNSSNNSIYNSSLENMSINQGYNYLYNTTITAATEYNSALASSDHRVFSHNHDNTANNHIIFMANGQISSESSVRNTSSGISWALRPTSATLRSESFPVSLKVATFAVSANALVTVKAYLRRTNTGLTVRLKIPKDQIAGVSSDITSSMTAVADTWEQVTLTFTPTEIGVVDLYCEAYGGSTYTGYIDDISISQA